MSDLEYIYKTMQKKTHPKISECIQNFILRDNLMFYGYFLLNVNFFETRAISTAGVNFSHLRMNFYYNPDFLDGLSQKQVSLLVIHELFHLLFSHPKRAKGYDHELSNIAMDMIINELVLEKHQDICETIPNIVLMDSEYEGERIFEILYEWLNKNPEKWKKKYKVGFDEHFLSDIPDDVKREIIRKQIANAKNRCSFGANEEYILSRLIKKNNDNFLKMLKRNVSFLKGFSKEKSIRKPSRRDLDGIKGKNKYSNLINCILDTSGSMNGQFETILSQIFKDDYEINLIQCDTSVKNFLKIKNKNDLKKMKIKGLGGTVIQPGIDYIISNKQLALNNLVILTDGCTDTLDFSRFKNKKVLILSNDKECPIVNGKNVKQIIVEKKS